MRQESIWAKNLTILFAILISLGCGGGGGGDSLSTEENVTISGKVDDGTANSPIPDALCFFQDQNDILYTTNSNFNGEYLFVVPPDVEGNIRCSPRNIPNLALSNFMSTRDLKAGDKVSGEDVTPARTVVAGIIDSENPAVPQARKLELLDDINTGRDPDLTLVVLLSTQLYKSMLKKNVDVNFGGGEGGGGGDGGGVGGDGGDGGDASPIVNARCEFIVSNNLKEGTVLNHAALADFLDDGMINRPDLMTVMEDLNPVVQGYLPEEIKTAFTSVFKMGLGNPYFDLTDENGEYFIEIPPNVPGFVRCYPPNQEKLVLATYVPGRQKDQSLLGQDVTPATTFFSHMIASELSEDLSTVKENYLNDYAGLMDVHIIKVGDTVTGFELQDGSNPSDKDVGLVAFSATSLFNILYKNGVNFDYLEALDDLVVKRFVDPVFLEVSGSIPRVQAEAWSSTVNTSNEEAANVLGTGMASALSTARINVTVSDTSGGIEGATVDIITNIDCVSGCGSTTDAAGELTLTLSDVPSEALDIIVEASAAGFQPTAVTTRVAAFATVDAAIAFTSTVPPCTYSISPTSRSFASSAGTGTIDVVANSSCTWSASEGASWITITSGSSGSGNGTVTYSVSANTSTSSRTATITAAGRSHTVTQAPRECTASDYAISPTSRSFTSSAGTGTIDVVATSNCTWNASEGVNWITITSGNSGSGNGTVTYSVSANTSTSPRTATITAAGKSHTVDQAANALPDLVITTGSPTVTPSTVAPGGTVTLSAWTVRNQGTAASVGFSNGFYLSTDATIGALDTYLDGNVNLSLAAGAQFAWGGPTLTIPAGTSPGTYYIGILVDRTNASAESNESNNFVNRQITVTALPDAPPTISNIRQQLVSNSFTCLRADGSTFIGYYYRISVDYQDPNGDVTRDDGAIVRLDGADFQWYGITGDGFSGSASADPCYTTPQSGRQFSMTVVDGAGLESNSLNVTIPR